jgi:hypothetical protein
MYIQALDHQCALVIPGAVHGFSTAALRVTVLRAATATQAVCLLFDTKYPECSCVPGVVTIDPETYDMALVLASPQSGVCVVRAIDQEED